MQENRNIGRILVVEDDNTILTQLDLMLKRVGYDVVCARTIQLANELVADSLREKKLFKLALLDLHVWDQSGGEFGRRIIDIIGNINVAIITANPDEASALTYLPDNVLIKPINSGTLLEMCAKLMKPLRNRIASSDVTLNHWIATQHFKGFESLKFHSRKMDVSNPNEDTEKITSVSSGDKAYINTVIYNNKEVDKDVVNIALSALLGCPGRCAFCKNHLNRKSIFGSKRSFIRQLTEDEIVGQAYLAMNSWRVKQAFIKNSKLKLVFNLTCEGDGLVWNLDNCMKAFRQLSEIPNLEVELIITSVGNEAKLLEFAEKYIDLPKTRHYRSINSLKKEVRRKLKPGVRDHSLEKIRDIDYTIATKTNEPVTISWIVIKGINDQPEDAKMIKSFYGDRFLPDGRPAFRIKLMPLVPGSLKDVEGFEHIKDTKPKDIENFHNLLKKEGVEDVRDRNIVGVLVKAGCGCTTVEWL